AMAEDGAEVLLTGHHGGDQAETILMRAAHGSGPKGLSGMAVRALVNSVPVWRPLLGLDRGQLAKLVAEAGMQPIADPSNVDTRYERVRWRNLMGALKNSGLTVQRINRFGQRMEQAEAALSEFARRQFARLGNMDMWGVVKLARNPLLELPRDTGVRVLRMGIKAVTGRENEFRIAPFEALYERLGGNSFPGATIGGAAIVRRGKELVIFREVSRIARAPVLVRGGETRVWDGRFKVCAPAGMALLVGPAPDFTRHAAQTVLGRQIDVPMAAVRAAPVLRNAQGALVAVGAHILDDKVKVAVMGPNGVGWQAKD
ncbi:MAG: hypothetical protein GXP01_08550, partial [Alphaproteobacteria bacterium]|nr:hypothetical protein [Alphaproteobacteria bacterium]